ncbi:MAG: flagellar hook-length control protein FliK [Gammaproteobacteria bacterium]
MNATPAVPQAPIASDPAQLSSPTTVNSANSGLKDGEFAAALNKAGAKPTRKAAGHGSAGSGSDGGQLPVTGNCPPPSAMADAVEGATPHSGAAGRPGSNGNAGPPSAIGSARGGTALEGTAVGAADQPAAGAATESLGGATDVQGAAGLAAGFSLSLGLAAGAGEPGAPNAGPGPLAGTEIAATPIAGTTQDSSAAQTISSVQELAPPKNVAGAGRAADSAGRTTLTATGVTAATDAATSAPSATAGGVTTAANDGSWTEAATEAATGADSTAQAVNAAAMAAASGVVVDDPATSDSTLSPQSDSATPNKGGAKGALGANAVNTASAPGLLVAAGRPAAATGASSDEVLRSEGSIGADKHGGSDNADSLVPDVSAGSAGAAQFSVNSSSAADTVAAPTLKLAAGVDTPEFGQGLADRVSWMVDNNLSSAKLQINPPQLGPIEVRISVQGDHAQVWLASHSAVTRDALESSSPKLREMLGSQGFGQVSVDISQRNFQDRSAHSQPYAWTPAASLSSAATMPVAAVSPPRLSSGAFDAYA